MSVKPLPDLTGVWSKGGEGNRVQNMHGTLLLPTSPLRNILRRDHFSGGGGFKKPRSLLKLAHLFA